MKQLYPVLQLSKRYPMVLLFRSLLSDEPKRKYAKSSDRCKISFLLRKKRKKSGGERGANKQSNSSASPNSYEKSETQPARFCAWRYFTFENHPPQLVDAIVSCSHRITPHFSILEPDPSPPTPSRSRFPKHFQNLSVSSPAPVTTVCPSGLMAR